MKIIDDDLVEEAANKFSETYWKQTTDYIKTSTFMSGVAFAEQQLTPLFVEFADYHHKYMRLIEIKERRMGHYSDIKTTQQLFEEFINTKKQ